VLPTLDTASRPLRILLGCAGNVPCRSSLAEDAHARGSYGRKVWCPLHVRWSLTVCTACRISTVEHELVRNIGRILRPKTQDPIAGTKEIGFYQYAFHHSGAPSKPSDVRIWHIHTTVASSQCLLTTNSIAGLGGLQCLGPSHSVQKNPPLMHRASSLTCVPSSQASTMLHCARCE
jgi:hypothetical protein